MIDIKWSNFNVHHVPQIISFLKIFHGKVRANEALNPEYNKEYAQLLQLLKSSAAEAAEVENHLQILLREWEQKVVEFDSDDAIHLYLQSIEESRGKIEREKMEVDRDQSASSLEPSEEVEALVVSYSPPCVAQPLADKKRAPEQEPDSDEDEVNAPEKKKKSNNR